MFEASVYVLVTVGTIITIFKKKNMKKKSQNIFKFMFLKCSKWKWKFTVLVIGYYFNIMTFHNTSYIITLYVCSPEVYISLRTLEKNILHLEQENYVRKLSNYVLFWTDETKESAVILNINNIA